jgi:hypothetical protein
VADAFAEDLVLGHWQCVDALAHHHVDARGGIAAEIERADIDHIHAGLEPVAFDHRMHAAVQVARMSAPRTASRALATGVIATPGVALIWAANASRRCGCRP